MSRTATYPSPPGIVISVRNRVTEGVVVRIGDGKRYVYHIAVCVQNKPFPVRYRGGHVAQAVVRGVRIMIGYIVHDLSVLVIAPQR